MPLRLGLANPGITGCLDIKGQNLNWLPLLNEEHGIYPAMKSLGLDAVGLTAPRLHSDVCPPAKLAAVLDCRGGPSYASTATLRTGSLAQRSAVRQDVGNDRRMWTDINLEDGQTLHWAVLSFPPEGLQRDAEWTQELEALARDINQIQELSVRVDDFFLCTGDMNIQPDHLCDHPEPSRTRQRAWELFLDRTGFALFNTASFGNPPMSLFLPTRNRWINILPHATRHDPRGHGRAIDLIFGSPSLVVDMFIHNSIGCGGMDCCPFPNCQEVGCGDHFLIHIEVALTTSDASSSAAPQFPGKWHCERRWGRVLRQIQGSLRSLTTLALQGCEDHSSAADFSVAALEASTVLLNTLAGAARDIWIGGGSAMERPQRPANLAGLIASDCPEDAADLGHELSLVDNSSALLQRTFRLLRPHAAPPVSCMLQGNQLMSEEETNLAWRDALRKQCTPHALVDTRYQQLVQDRLRVLLDQARTLPKPDNSLDQPFLQQEVLDVIADWSTSRAMPPDLLPRAIFTCNDEAWNDVVWALQRWAGPAATKHRPTLWRAASLSPIHKKGNHADVLNFRLIFIKAQMGLIQEALLTKRWSCNVRNHVLPCQSGFVRGVEDAWLLLHETCAEAMEQKRPLWLVMGDFEKAFPSVIRQDLLQNLADGPGLSGDSLLLCNSILQEDSVLIWHSGLTQEVVMSGIPEGGMMGPFAYPCLLDSLVRELLAKECGVGVDVKVPGVWSNMKWRGLGAPCPNVVNFLKRIILQGGLLPPAEALAANPVLEASALKAMSDLAPLRLVAVLHADDPVILGCCRGETQRSLHILANWAWKHGASFHIGESKTVAMFCHSNTVNALQQQERAQSVLTLQHQGVHRPLSFQSKHKWLGIIWTASLSFQEAMTQKAALASTMWSTLCALVRSRALPLDLAIKIFRSKVLAVLLHGSCMYGLEGNLVEFLSGIQDSWARQMFLLENWRNAAVAAAELGWKLPLHLEVVTEVAMRRYRLWQLPNHDLYKGRFLSSHAVAQSWAHKSLRLIRSWGIVDWIELENPAVDYRSYVRRHLEERHFATWLTEAQQSRQPPSYVTFQSTHSDLLRDEALGRLTWSVRVGVLSLCKLRAGALCFSCLNGRRSRAQIQHCIFCNRRTKAARVHVLSVCDYWEVKRQQTCRQLPVTKAFAPADISRHILGCRPHQEAFASLVAWAVELDKECASFWNGR